MQQLQKELYITIIDNILKSSKSKIHKQDREQLIELREKIKHCKTKQSMLKWLVTLGLTLFGADEIT